MELPPPASGETKQVLVRLGKVESVDLYEIKDSELELFEKGSPTDLQLNFAIFLLSLAFSSICSLATATFTVKRTETIFIFVAVVGILLGLYLLISWWRNHTSLKKVCEKIRNRIPPAVSPALADTEAATSISPPPVPPK
jgi:hypothetical protein